jgi:GT2 family glycosyltransferase
VPRLSVVISTFGNYEVLRRVLDGYSQQDAPPGSFEVIVVTDAADPEPESVERAIGERPYPVRRITGPTPGLSANRNAGWRDARAPLVMFTDNDTIPQRTVVSEHIEWHRRFPDETVGVIGRVRWHPELEVTTFMRWLDMGLQFDAESTIGIEAGWGRLYGANSSLKRSFIERVGDFDQENFPYGYEDTDWAYRALKQGFRLLYNRAAVVDHLRPMSLEFWEKRIWRYAANERRFSRLYPELPPWWHGKFTEAMRMPPARGRAIRVARYVPKWVPWLGPRVWRRVDIAYKQALAPHFLKAWDEAGEAGDGPRQPDLSEFDSESSAGASAGGPK